jgi:hypothetical protein
MTKICKNTKCQKELTNGKRIWCSDDCRKKQSHVLPRNVKGSHVKMSLWLSHLKKNSVLLNVVRKT